jgi:hypothetical protein
MRGKYFILNCFSNFHNLLRLLVKHGGCAFVSQPVVVCLNQQQNAKFKICGGAGWNGQQAAYDKCASEKSQALQEIVHKALRK